MARILIWVLLSAGVFAVLLIATMVWLWLPPSGPGAHLVLDVDMARYWRDDMRAQAVLLGQELQAQNVAYSDLVPSDDQVSVHIPDAPPAAQNVLHNAASRAGLVLTEARPGDFTLAATDLYRRASTERAVKMTAAVIERRLRNLFSYAASAHPSGGTRIVVSIAGKPDLARLHALFVVPGNVGLHAVDDDLPAMASVAGRLPPGEVLLPGPTPGGFTIIAKRVLMRGDHIVDAQPGFDDGRSEPIVSLRLDDEGRAEFARITQANINRRFAIVLDGKVLMAPVVREPITGGALQISGNFTPEQTQNLAALLRSGVLPAPVRIVEEGVGLPQ